MYAVGAHLCIGLLTNAKGLRLSDGGAVHPGCTILARVSAFYLLEVVVRA